MKSLTFDDDLTVDVLNEDKTATVRKGWRDDIQVGDIIEAKTKEGDYIAELSIERVIQTAAIASHHQIEVSGAEYPSEHPKDVLNILEKYYEDIEPSSGVTIYVFEVQ
jgi:hypothetical protein